VAPATPIRLADRRRIARRSMEMRREPGGGGMEKVSGIGGVFFRAKDPAALAAWYRDMLGISPAPTDMDGRPWTTAAGITIFAPFAAETDYFPPSQQVMINFRVADLDAMLTQLQAGGVLPLHRTEMAGVGRFARVADPEGNAIELWEPAP
jgi:predicted enzyme related to lactoylglutathione lyase